MRSVLKTFNQLSIGTRLGSLIAVVTLAFFGSAAFDISHNYESLLDSSKTEVQQQIQTVKSLVGHYARAAEQGAMSEDDARAAALSAVTALRYGDGEYFWIQDRDAKILAHGAKPELAGTDQSGANDKDGKRLFAEMVDVVKRAGGGFVSYSWDRPGSAKPLPKVSYVEDLGTWGWIGGTGVYIDDVATDTWNDALVSSGFIAAMLAMTIGLALVITRSVTRPIKEITSIMGQLSGGRRDVTIPATDRGDEIGQMAKALAVFKDGLLEAERLAVEQARVEADKTRRARAIEALMTAFQTRGGQLIGSLEGASRTMESTAQAMTGDAQKTTARSEEVSAAAQQTTSNVQAVASATEELAASANEIGSRASMSAGITRQAVDNAKRTNETVRQLASGAQQIGDVIDLIRDIAAQTNLLALNATIEAARAGEAGRGFAVVAAEVKGLADQTTRATATITGQVQAIQESTGQVVQAIDDIGQVINEVYGITTEIAAAVEEQQAAAREIARNVNQAAEGSAHVGVNIEGVRVAAAAAGQAAAMVLTAARDVSATSESFKGEVEALFAGVRNA